MAKTGEVNPDLVRERSRTSFDIRELTHFLEGSEEKTQRRKELESVFYDDPELQDKVPLDYLAYDELYEESLRKAYRIFPKAMDLADPREVLAIADGIMHESAPLTVHFVMFIPALMGHATEKQQQKWLLPSIELKILGTYAQTELGHGTFLRGLETTATYDPETEEFVLNTPTPTAVKWWPGGLGKTANHAIVVAQLYTKGKCHGIHPFMVQIRDMNTHMPMKGITVGEIGPKMGLKAADNGFLKFDNYRIPRENMLMRNARVTKEGEYIKPKSDKLNYATMVFVRVIILDMVSFNLSRACTIAIRYSAVRKQSKIEAEKNEVQILDYQAQQYKLFPMLALCHAFKATFVALMNKYKSASGDIERGDLSVMPELHATSSGLKALSSEIGSNGIERCRMACGGHGFLLISGLPRLYAQTVAACTYEGENTVLYLQTARFLLKVMNKQQPVPLASILQYLYQEPNLKTEMNRDPTSFDYLLAVYKAAAYRAVFWANQRFEKAKQVEGNPEIAWNSSQVDLIKGAKAHLMYFVAVQYVDWVENNDLSPQLRTVLRRLCRLFLLSNIYEDPGIYMQAGLTVNELQVMRDKMLQLLGEIRPDAISLVDAFDFHDVVLGSALGAYDGQVYTRMYDLAQKTKLNQTQVHPSYYKYLQPIAKSNL